MSTKSRLERRERERERATRRRIGAAVFAVLLQIAAGVPQMPLVPYGAIFITVSVAMLIYLFVTAESVERLPVSERAFGAWCIVLLSASIAWMVLPAKWMEEKAAALEGDLSLNSSNAKRRLVEIGEGITPLDDETPDGNLIGMFSSSSDSKITIERIDGHLLLSTEVHDAQGKRIAELVRNHWSVNSDKTVCLDKNYTSDSLEVKDGRGHVVLQVRLYPDLIRLQGEWFDDRGRGIELVGGQVIGMFDPDRKWFVEKLIPEVFKYPSSKHWAEWK